MKKKGGSLWKNTSTAENIYVDPVCGMKVNPGSSRPVANDQGHSYWFCNEACRHNFENNPKKYLDRKGPKRKGIWGRYLERLNGTTDGKALKCH